MQRMFVNVNNSRFVLPEGVDGDSLKQEIQSAAHTGGAFVDIPRSLQSPVSVLITPASSVMLYEEPDSEPETTDLESDVISDLEWISWTDV
ncbi:hypothetical protein ALI44B_01135 [Leifsonia sp. ALI-44-B]|uniref:hypothetical protein n=1 Tax=Leifsonia sp. ALI-44-B TaxID=1933776 RepID=UPI00097CA2E1|nr:hypothetical protein [Leifsonia sp. ALI-44-B]ONI65327.1 hypothetical protein ALI44B_01135 [Leifsonia sp. ALI-44-B]